MRTENKIQFEIDFDGGKIDVYSQEFYLLLMGCFPKEKTAQNEDKDRVKSSVQAQRILARLWWVYPEIVRTEELASDLYGDSGFDEKKALWQAIIHTRSFLKADNYRLKDQVEIETVINLGYRLVVKTE